MAEPKHNWAVIKKAYYDEVIGKNVPLKQLAQEHNVSYNYMRKKSSEWKQDREVARDEFILAVEEETRSADTMTASDRNLKHIQAYDIAMTHCMTVLNNPMQHLCTLDGIFKPANLERIVATIDKCQKGQRLALGLDNNIKDSKSLLGDISDAISLARERYNEVEDDTDES